MAAALVIAVVAIGGGLWWLLDSTVPVSDYDEVVAELDATEDALERARTDAAALSATNRDLRSSVDDAIQPARGWRSAALLLGYFAGVDPEIVDQEQYDSWSGVVELDGAVQLVNDTEFTELYWEHLGECSGISPGCEELLLRLIELTIEPILEDR